MKNNEIRTGCHCCPRIGPRAGFTLVELVVATSLSSALVLSALHFFVQERALLKSSEIISETRQNVRTAFDMLSRDIRMAGYGLHINSSELATWVDWAEDLTGTPIDMDSNPKIVDGGIGSPDAIWIAAAFDETPASLAVATVTNATVIVLGEGQGDHFDTTTRKLIQVGQVETARVVAKAGDLLTVSTDPTSIRGLQFDHPVGSEVALVTVRAYETHDTSVVSYPYRPYLTRDDCIGTTFNYHWERMIAAGISDLQLVRIGDRVDFVITGEAPVQDRFYANGEDGSKIRNISLESSALIRNDT